MTPLEVVLDYISRGWAPIPIPYRAKGPTITGWPDLRITATTAPSYFNSSPVNIGVVLGPASGGLVDVDLDSPEAGAVAPYLLPPTRAIFGRPSAPNSHWLYRVSAAEGPAVAKFADPEATDERAGLVELRRGGERGAQTVFPSSTHPSGETIAWVVDDAPPEVVLDELARRVKVVAAAALFARCWPAQGDRHNKALLVGGVLSRAGFTLPAARLFAEAVARAAGDSEWRDRVAAVDFRPGAARAGLPALAEWLGDKRAKAIAAWLDYPDTATVDGRRWQSGAGSSARSGEEAPGDEAPGDEGAPIPDTAELAIAAGFAERHADDLRYVASWGRWFHWRGASWLVDDTLAAFDLARAACRDAAGACPMPSTAKQVASAKTVAAVTTLARADRRIAATTDQWDRDPWLLNTPAGVVDLRTGQLRPHGRSDFMTKLTAVGPGGPCPRWLAFLERVTAGDRELQAYLQRLAGYALTGLTREHVLPFAHGSGANGKSVFIATVAGAWGDYHQTSPIETFTATTSERHPTDLAMLRGARLVTAIETEEGRRWAELKIKALTGGDRISARFMRQDFFTYEPQFTLLIAGNHKPGLRSVDEAIRRRFHLIPFAVTIPAEERDETLPERLRAEWPGILSWAIEGCLAWQQGGLRPPPAVISATEAYLDGQDAIGAWLDEACIRQANSWTARTELFGSWQAWAEKAREFVLPRPRFFDALEARGFVELRATGGERGFRGIALKQVDYSNAYWNC